MQNETFDLIVVGGGIHGLIIGLTAAEAGHRTLLLEKRQLASGASGGWFRILHGGLRYLQNLDLPRFRASLQDSRWFLREFPELVERQKFLMPLYGQGLKRPAVFRLAFQLERMLGPDRNRGVPAAKRIPRGKVLAAEATARLFPAVSRDGLQGGALWEELVVPGSDALIAAMAARARVAGLAIREYSEVTHLVSAQGRVTGVRAAGTEVNAAKVILAAGPANSVLTRAVDPGAGTKLGFPALAFNLLLDRPCPATTGLSLAIPGKAGGMIFLYPMDGGCFAGTAYQPCPPGTLSGSVPAEAIRDFLAQCNAACPELGAREDDVLSVTSGLLPAATSGDVDLLDRDVIHDHGAHGGPKGLISLTSVKFTTAPSIARRVLHRAFGTGG